jgi:hypothetical protein
LELAPGVAVSSEHPIHRVQQTAKTHRKPLRRSTTVTVFSSGLPQLFVRAGAYRASAGPPQWILIELSGHETKSRLERRMGETESATLPVNPAWSSRFMTLLGSSGRWRCLSLVLFWAVLHFSLPAAADNATIDLDLYGRLLENTRAP